MTHAYLVPLIVVAGLTMASCGSAPVGHPKDYVLTCLHETGAKGSYVRSDEQIAANGLAKIIPAEGGDMRGAVLMEACIEEQHKRAGTLPKVSAPSAPTMMSTGKLTVPQGYNLSAEEVALWKSLTVEQQKRAYEFLKTGSTIQSSLLED